MENEKKVNASADAKKKQTMIRVLIGLIVLGAIGGGIYLKIISGRVYIEKAEVNAPMIGLSANNPGTLEELFVKEGDNVVENQVVARVGNEMIKAQSDGLVVKVSDNIGKSFAKNEAVVTIIKIGELRVIGHLEEDKGLKDIQIGQQAIFTVDAYGSKKFYGIVDDVSETSRDSDIVFSISDKKEKKKFDIKIRFNPAAYPELKNGMSAEAWVYKS